LEDIKFSLRPKPVRDHPLVSNEGQSAQRFGGFGAAQKGFLLATTKYDNSTAESGEENSDDEAGGILDKVKAVSHYPSKCLVRSIGRVCQH
jgi:hypothetical protein